MSRTTRNLAIAHTTHYLNPKHLPPVHKPTTTPSFLPPQRTAIRPPLFLVVGPCFTAVLLDFAFFNVCLYSDFDSPHDGFSRVFCHLGVAHLQPSSPPRSQIHSHRKQCHVSARHT
jgi:hypothetical protein